MVWLDANMDGAIDVILFAKPPSEEQSDVIGAELYLSTGYHKRQWTLQKNNTLSELSSTAILTDLDGKSVYTPPSRLHLAPSNSTERYPVTTSQVTALQGRLHCGAHQLLTVRTTKMQHLTAQHLPPTLPLLLRAQWQHHGACCKCSQ